MKQRTGTLEVEFEDKGQDFLRWTIKDGVVVACEPFQKELWKGTKVHSTMMIKPGDTLVITVPGRGNSLLPKRTLNYKVEVVKVKLSRK